MAAIPNPYDFSKNKKGVDAATGTAGSGDDMVIGSNYNDILSGGDGNDTITGGNGSDTIYGGTGNDIIWGASKDFSDNGSDVMYGGSGKDKIYGGNGTDTIFGDGKNSSTGTPLGGDIVDRKVNDSSPDATTDAVLATYNDTIDGGNGGDRIIGGLGGDSLTGNNGPDVFVYDRIADSRSKNGEGAGDVGDSLAGWDSLTGDVITDFQKGTDKLDFTTLNTATNGALHFGGSHTNGISRMPPTHICTLTSQVTAKLTSASR